MTLSHVAVSATCLHSASYCLWLHALEVAKQRAPAVEEEGHHDFLPVLVWNFGFLWRGRIEVFPLLALPFALGLKMVAPCFVPCDDTRQKRILFLVVPVQMNQTCSHSVNRLPLRQLMRNPLRENFLNCRRSLIMACTEPRLMPTWTRICCFVIRRFSRIKPSIGTVT